MKLCRHVYKPVKAKVNIQTTCQAVSANGNGVLGNHTWLTGTDQDTHTTHTQVVICPLRISDMISDQVSLVRVAKALIQELYI